MPYHGEPGGYPPPQPPRSGSPVKLVLLGLVAVIAVGFFFIALMGYLGNDDEQAGPLPTPTVGQTSAPPVGVPDPDPNPPDLPFPKDGAEAEQWLVNNPLYAGTVQVPTNCTLGRVSPTTATPQELEDHLNLLTACLMMVWQEPLQRAGFVLPRPPVTVYSQPITTACGEQPTHNAFYCGADQRFYYATDLPEIFGHDPQVVDNAFLLDNVMGHEFGHAIQGRSGIWTAFIGFRAGTTTKADADALTRRSEVQADCLAGIFLNAIAQASQMTDAERVGTAEVTQAVGDDRLSGDPNALGDHGLGVNRRHWFETGNATNQIGACNTWTAPDDQVR